MKTAAHPHPYREDDSIAPDWQGRRWCLCGRIETHPDHQLPEQDQDVTTAERRRVGERGDD